MDDLAAPQHRRSGAHRARRHPLLGALVALGGVAVVSATLLWALLTFDVLGVGDDLPVADGPAVLPSTDPSGVVSVAPSPPADGTGPTGADPEVTGDVPSDPASDPASDGAGTVGTEGQPEPSESPDEQAVDRSLTVDVLNSTATPGLAAGAGARLEDLGWTIGEVANFEGDEIATTVLFPQQGQEATAAAVADDIGIGTVTPSEDVDVITLVIGPDYSG